jgi:hypothetical protein
MRIILEFDPQTGQASLTNGSTNPKQLSLSRGNNGGSAAGGPNARGATTRAHSRDGGGARAAVAAVSRFPLTQPRDAGAVKKHSHS